MNDRRLIEEAFPVREVSTESVREKSIRHGHISTLHIWWARRPLAASRATAYAALVPAPESEEDRLRQLQVVAELAEWESASNAALLERVREAISKAHGNRTPRVLDCFAGGGAIPLEALRLGCETYALDYNPVAVLLLKAVLEYPQRFGRPGEVEREVEQFGRRVRERIKVDNLLADAVRRWGQWVLEEVHKELARFYRPDPDGSVPVGYLWARTIPCQNPACGAEIPLMRQFWLVRKEKRRVALYPEAHRDEVRFRVVGSGYEAWPEGFDPDQGTVSQAVARCLVCGATVDADTVRRLFRDGQSGERLIAVVLRRPREQGNGFEQGKYYRVSAASDMNTYRAAEEYLQRKREVLWNRWGIDPVPDEATPAGGGRGSERAFSLHKYGLLRWGDLFNARQLLALITFVEAVRAARDQILRETGDAEFATAVATYLALAVDRLADYNSVLCRWHVTGEKISNTFTRQALPIVWDYVELNPFSGATGDWGGAIEWITKVIEHTSKAADHPAAVRAGSATALPWPDGFLDAVLTDPPYYDNVPYSDLSDFFYVWLKRSVGDLHSDLFLTPLTPKDREMVADATRAGSFEKAKERFEQMLRQSFREIWRVLRPGGVAVVVYAHKTTAGWETLVNAMMDSGLAVVGSWPIDTEMTSRLRAQDSAALASSVYIVARKLPQEELGLYPEVKTKLSQVLPARLQRLWEDGLSGPDLLIAGIGAGLEVFGRYRQVLDYEGNVVRADRILADVRAVVADFAIRQILHNGLAAELSERSRFYLLYRWCFGDARVEFDEARKLAQAVGVDLGAEWSRRGSFVRRERDHVRVLGPHERLLGDLEQASDLVDVMHRAARHWEQGEREAMARLLAGTGWGGREVFWRTAQAISSCLAKLSPTSKERQLLDGLLGTRERMTEAIQERARQLGLFDH